MKKATTHHGVINKPRFTGSRKTQADSYLSSVAFVGGVEASTASVVKFQYMILRLLIPPHRPQMEWKVEWNGMRNEWNVMEWMER